ncbi:MAG TPA: hypothetical protein PKC39_10040 [Ferruginibacter sp.]|nr:hypothetical protein [Ferruginibacter sp.]HMP21289.1 hypothetical protein [Ferruginibacter sp.]
MKLKLLLAAMLLCITVYLQAQVIKSPAAFRALQNANTLLEAKQLLAAEDYFKIGLKKAQAAQDKYCEALANEGLGNLYTKLEANDKAAAHYTAAIKLYKDLRQTVKVAVIESLLKSVQGVGDLYAGIEVGAKGVKMSIVEVRLSADREYGYTLVLDTSINTDAAALTYQSEVETSSTIAKFLDVAKKRFNIPPYQVFVVIASGLKQDLDKYNKVEYFAKVIRPKNMDPLTRVSYITPEEEAQLSVLGVVPEKHRFAAGQLDVGSGNTKGGYFTAQKEFVPFTYPLGTKTFQRLIGSQSSLYSYVNAGERLWADSLEKSVLDELSQKSELKQKNIIYLSGGIVWSIVSLLYPESTLRSYTEISPRDIAEFRQKLLNNYDELTRPNLAFTGSPDEAEIAAKNISNVLKTYDQKAMTAGTMWLSHLIRELNTVNPGKKFVYFKYAYVGWISGYIINKITSQYTAYSIKKPLKVIEQN